MAYGRRSSPWLVMFALELLSVTCASLGGHAAYAGLPGRVLGVKAALQAS